MDKKYKKAFKLLEKLHKQTPTIEEVLNYMYTTGVTLKNRRD